jgi:hypothetical protein
MVLAHVVAAAVALLSGAIALYALKGGRLHRSSGMVFVYSMLIMSSTGAVMALLQPNLGNVMGGVLTFYLVLSGLLTVRSRVAEFQRADVAVLLMPLFVAVAGVSLGSMALASADGTKNGVPAPAYFVFAAVALLALAGDLRMMLGRRLEGAPRLARHLWRMCFAFWIATASFFLGPSRRLPAPLRHSPLLPVPVVLVLLVMFYWLARVSVMQRRARSLA